MIGKRWVIWKLAAYGSGVHGPDTDDDPDAKGVEKIHSAHIVVMPTADLYSDEAQEAVAKGLAENALGEGVDPNHVSLFYEDAEKILKGLRGALEGRGSA